LANHSLTKNHKPGSGSIPKPEPPIEIPDTIDPRPKVSGTRRSWSKGQKLAVLREADATSVEAVMSRHSLNYEQIKRWRGIVIDGKPDRPHIKRVDSTTTLPKSNGSDTVQQPRGLSHRHEAYIQLRRWYDARLKWIRSGGTPGTHDVYAELALRALEGSNK
jgi:transposase-like protein